MVTHINAVASWIVQLSSVLLWEPDTEATRQPILCLDNGTNVEFFGGGSMQEQSGNEKNIHRNQSGHDADWIKFEPLLCLDLIYRLAFKAIVDVLQCIKHCKSLVHIRSTGHSINTNVYKCLLYMIVSIKTSIHDLFNQRRFGGRVAKS